MRVIVVLVVGTACGRVGFDHAAPGSAGDAGAPDAEASFAIEGPGTWTATSPPPIPPRLWTSAVWTGTEFIVYGGALDASYTPTETGARFDPVAGAWTPLPTTNAPNKRHTPHMVWTRDRLIVYGGGWGLGPVDSGGTWDPQTNTWQVMAASPPGLRIYGTAAAIDHRMLVWGGWANAPGHYQSGFIYDPQLDSWTQISTTGAPTARSLFASVWTGSRVIVWGGCDGAMGSCPGVKGDGGIYDPATDTWSPMTMAGAPSPRSSHTAVWTGSEMIVFGGATSGNDGGRVDTGAIYAPTTDSWRPMTTVGAPSPRSAHAAAWIGNKMVVWGGSGIRDGFLYDPVTDAWSPMNAAGTPTGRSRFAFAGGGTYLFIWGGSYTDDSGGLWRADVVP